MSSVERSDIMNLPILNGSEQTHGGAAVEVEACKKKGEALCDFCEEYDEIPRVAVERQSLGGYWDEAGVWHGSYEYLCEVCVKRCEEAQAEAEAEDEAERK